MTSAVALRGEAQEVALAETQAVLAMARDEDYRGRLASLQAAATEGEVAGEDAETLQELLEVGPPERAAARALRAGRRAGGAGRPTAGCRAAPPSRERARGLGGSARAGGPGAALGLARGDRAGRVHALARRRLGGDQRPSRPAGRAAAFGGRVSDKRYYMACLDLEGRSVLVVGGGNVALEKVQGLLESGARVTVVAPEARAGAARAADRVAAARVLLHRPARPLPRRRRDVLDAAQPPRLRRRRGAAACSATSSTCPSSARSSSPRSTARGRSPWPSRPAAPRPPSRSGSGTTWPRSSDRATPRSPRSSARVRPVGEGEPADVRGPPGLLPAARRGGAGVSVGLTELINERRHRLCRYRERE